MTKLVATLVLYRKTCHQRSCAMSLGRLALTLGVSRGTLDGEAFRTVRRGDTTAGDGATIGSSNDWSSSRFDLNFWPQASTYVFDPQDASIYVQPTGRSSDVWRTGGSGLGLGSDSHAQRPSHHGILSRSGPNGTGGLATTAAAAKSMRRWASGNAGKPP